VPGVLAILQLLPHLLNIESPNVDAGPFSGCPNECNPVMRFGDVGIIKGAFTPPEDIGFSR